MDAQRDRELRLLALEELDQLIDAHGLELSRDQFRNLDFPVKTPHLADRQKGIWNPSWLDATLSVLTSHNSKYPDEELGDGVWAYSYREGSTEGDNRKLRTAHDLGVDIIYFRPAPGGKYVPVYPVRVAEVYPEDRKVILVRKDVDRIDWTEGAGETMRQWAEQTVQRRLHQRQFREMVMRAYESTCAICHLKYERLLDAAHIDSDRSDFGDASVTNGIALCKIHHHAFDWNFLGVNPKMQVVIKREIREASDGPMLMHGLQEMHGRLISLPRLVRQHPDQARLERRYDKFKRARPGSHE